MLKKMLISVALLISFISMLSAESNSWHVLSKIAAGQKLEIVQKDSKSVKGEFSDYDENSISLIKKGKIVIFARSDVFTVGLQGASKRKRHVLIGMAIGAGTGLALGLITTRKDEGLELISDEAVTATLGIMGAGVGALTGAVVPAHEYGIIYRAPGR